MSNEISREAGPSSVESRAEKEKQPTLSVFVIRHAEAWPSSQDPERNLTPEGERYTKETADQIADALGNPDQWIINQLDARNFRAARTAAINVEQLQERGFYQFFKPIKAGKGGLTGKEKLEISDKPREHTAVPRLARKIMTAPISVEGSERMSLMDYYRKQLAAEGKTEPPDVELIQAWLEDENLPENIETPQQIKEFLLSALQKQQDILPKLAQVLPADKRIATVIGVNNPRMDLLVEAITGVSLKEHVEKKNEITPRSQGVRIDFHLNRPPEFSVFGRAETTVAKKEKGKLTEEREPVEAFESKLKEWAKPRPIESIKVKE